MLFFSDAIIATVDALFDYFMKNNDESFPNVLYELVNNDTLTGKDWVKVCLDDNGHVTVCKL